MRGEVPTAAPCGGRVKGGPLEGLAQGGEAIRRASRDDLSGHWVGPRVDPGCRTGELVEEREDGPLHQRAEVKAAVQERGGDPCPRWAGGTRRPPRSLATARFDSSEWLVHSGCHSPSLGPAVGVTVRLRAEW